MLGWFQGFDAIFVQVRHGPMLRALDLGGDIILVGSVQHSLLVYQPYWKWRLTRLNGADFIHVLRRLQGRLQLQNGAFGNAAFVKTKTVAIAEQLVDTLKLGRLITEKHRRPIIWLVVFRVLKHSFALFYRPVRRHVLHLADAATLLLLHALGHLQEVVDRCIVIVEDRRTFPRRVCLIAFILGLQQWW